MLYKIWFIILDKKEDKETYKKIKNYLKSHRIKFSNSKWFDWYWSKKVRATMFIATEEEYNKICDLGGDAITKIC